MARSRRPALVFGIVPMLALLAAAPARGALIRYDFGGVITSTSLAGGSAPGTRFSGSFTVDDSAAPSSTTAYPDGVGYRSNYLFGTHRPGDPTADGSGLVVRIGDGPPIVVSDGLTVNSYNADPGTTSPSMRLDFRGDESGPDRPSSVLVFQGSDNLGPARPLPAGLKLDSFVKAELVVRPPNDPDRQSPAADLPLYLGTIDALTATPVPEPAWTVAALMGAAFWAASRRTRA